MVKMSILHFFPEKIGWIGLALLGLGVSLALPSIFTLSGDGCLLPVHKAREPSLAVEPYTFSLALNDKGPVLPIPELKDEMTFSFDPPRPVSDLDQKRVLIRMKNGAESRRVVLPCRLDLEYQKDRLVFSKKGSSFWIELALAGEGQIDVRGFITSLEGERVEAGKFVVAGQECPIQGAQEFPEGSPFRLLAEAKWWGRDLFSDPQDCGERIEIGTAELHELKSSDWLVWRGQKWEKSLVAEKEAPIARVHSVNGKYLVLEAWDANGHIRVSLAAASAAPFKVRAEDLFSSIRIRSEKQISCVLEKQCMVLKTGDWVLKTGSRWKVLRKKDERDAFINGKLFGELFVFEQIAQKQGQKMVVGRIFNPGRTQVAAIEMAAQSGRKVREKGMQKGKSR